LILDVLDLTVEGVLLFAAEHSRLLSSGLGGLTPLAALLEHENGHANPN